MWYGAVHGQVYTELINNSGTSGTANLYSYSSQLQYPDLELTVQRDSSKYCLGAVLLQGGRPIEYGSRSLSSSQRKWAQIEKEALFIMFVLEKLTIIPIGKSDY